MKILLIDGDYLLTRLLQPVGGRHDPKAVSLLDSRLNRLLRNQMDALRPTHVLWIWQGAMASDFLDDRRQRRVHAAQVGGSSQRIQGMGIHQLKLDGSRTGNVLSAIAQLPRPAAAQTFILGADPLYYTLLGQPNTVLHDPFTRSKPRRWMTSDSFVSQYGIRPEQWPLCLAMAGYPGAAIKGVPGIGQKGALRLLAEAGLSDIDKIALKAPVRHGLLLRKHMRQLKDSYLPQTSLKATPHLPISWPDIRYRRPETPRPSAQPSH